MDFLHMNVEGLLHQALVFLRVNRKYKGRVSANGTVAAEQWIATRANLEQQFGFPTQYRVPPVNIVLSQIFRDRKRALVNDGHQRLLIISLD
jgi:hypothetical protein